MSYMPLYDGDRVPQPKDQVKIETLEIVVYPDRFRVFIHLVVTPFQERPNLLVAARSESGTIVSEMSIIETMHNDMEFTMHLRGLDEPAGTYTLNVDLYFETRNPPQDRRVETFVVPEASEEDTEQ